MQALRPATFAAMFAALAAVGCGDSTGARSAPPVVVFGRFFQSQRDIFKVTLDGQALVQLTSNSGDNREPAVAGETVVFTSYRDGNGELYSVPLAGGAARRLTNTQANETQPALARSGSKLAFVSDVTRVTRLWIAAADGSGAAPAAPTFGGPGTIDASPAWSPSGDRLVFVSTGTTGQASLYVLVLPTGPVTPLPVGPTPNVEPAWSADGRSIAFASGRAGGKGIYRFDLETGAVTLLVPGNVGQPAWTRDGRLVYTAFTSFTDSRLFWIDPAQPGTAHAIDTGDGSASDPRSP